MAFLGQTFNATQVAPSAPMELLPPGDYVAQITSSEMRNTKDNSGQYLWLEMDILDGEYTNRKIWSRLNLVNSNPGTVEGAYRDLSAICHATGVLEMSDTEQLHCKPMIVSVKVKPPKNGYEASNEVKGYKPLNGQQPQQQPQQARPAAFPAQQQQQPAKPAAGGPAPWRRQ